MRKFILMLVVMFTTMLSVNAQIATENPKLLDNTYISLEGGVTTPLDMNSMFPLNEVVGLKLGKEWTPIIGTEIVGQLFMNDNHDVRWTSAMIKGNYLGANATVNLNNLFDGYNGKPRVFEIKANGGLGWIHRWCYGGNSFGAKTGLDFNINIGKKRAHTLSISPAVYWDLHKTDGFNKHWAQLGLFIGYTYHFKTSNGTHYFKTYDVGSMIDEIDRLNDELVKKPKEVIVEKVGPTNIITETIEGKKVIYFAFDSDEITDEMKSILDSVQPGTYDINGYASSEGTTEYNKYLSQRRAEAVANYLINKEGVKINSCIGYGVLFGNITGRVVEIIPSK